MAKLNQSKVDIGWKPDGLWEALAKAYSGATGTSQQDTQATH